VKIDDGVSGTNFKRPGLTALIKEVESDRISTVIIKDAEVKPTTTLSTFSTKSVAVICAYYINRYPLIPKSEIFHRISIFLLG